jgi:cold shock CspA family protein
MFPAVSKKLTPLISFFSTTETGTVKLYRRKEAYGFITSDIDQQDVFVHRTDIKNAPSDDIFNPILQTGERVKFTRTNVDGKRVGSSITYEDGTNIPIYRQNKDRKDRIRLIKSRLGFKIYNLFSSENEENDDDSSEDMVADKIMMELHKAQREVEYHERNMTLEENEK